jgi:hypothetical protein
VLTLHIPQPEARKPRRIQIGTGAAQTAVESQTNEQPALAAAAA